MRKIEKIDVWALGPDLPRTTWASMPPQFMTMIAVRVTDSDGTEGIGGTESYAAGQFDLSVFEATRTLAARIVGSEAGRLEQTWQQLQTYVLPAAPGAVAVLDVALWDLEARRAGMPLYRFLGGARSRALAYASTPELADVPSYLDHVSDLQAKGFRAIKFHAWNVPERDLEMLAAVSAKFAGSGLQFMHDAENRYDRRSALRVAQALEEMNFRWFEAPFIDYDVEGYAELRRRVKVPIIPHGLWMTDLMELRHALMQNPWDAVRFDVTSAGGFTLGRKICALAEAFGLPVELQSWGYSLIQAANLHLELAMDRQSFFELPVPYDAYEFGVKGSFRPDVDGCVSVAEAPGLGLSLDWEAMARAELAHSEVLSA